MPGKERIVIFALLSAALLLAGCKTQNTEAMSPAAMVVPVTVAAASLQDVPVEIRVVGTVEPSAKVEIKSMVAGQIMSVHFTEGRNVNEGDLLFEIDPRPYREALRQAEATVARDRAQQDQARATLSKDVAQSKAADTEARRYDALLKDRLVSQQQQLQYAVAAETAKETVRADQAAVATAGATLDVDLAAVDKAKLDLSYCQIRAPLSGRTGNLLVQPGNLVKVNDVAIVVINRVAPVFVSFNAPDKYLETIRHNQALKPLTVEVIPRENPGVREKGFLSVVDNTVDTQTGTIHLKSTFGNANGSLWPGQFVDVALTLSRSESATVIPSEAVQAGQKGQFVYVVKADKTVEPRLVSVGHTVGAGVIVEQGIAAGETVVTDGQMMLFPGAHIAIAPAPQGDSGVR